MFGFGLGRGLRLGLGFGPLEGEDRRGFSGFFDAAFSQLEEGEESLGLLQYNHKADKTKKKMCRGGRAVGS